MPTGSKVPRWKLDSIYPGFESEEYRDDRAALTKSSTSLLRKLDDQAAQKQSPAKWLKGVLKKLNAARALFENLMSYVYCRYATSTRDQKTVQELNNLEEAALPLKEAEALLRVRLKGMQKALPGLYKESKSIARHRYYLEEQIFLQNRQMSLAEENLAADLSRPGADAWGRLQETISSNLSVPWEGDEKKTVVQLRSLATSADRAVREKAYEKELGAWKSMEIPLAAALNGVKGFSVILDKRRNYRSSLERAAVLSRISTKTLDALIGVMEKSLPMFRGYLKSKAKLMGVERCAFYDLYAPVGATEKVWSFPEARTFIVEQFNSFSPELGDFANSAFKQGWIDAESREGKVGGAFCTFLPLAKESRVLANFDGSFDTVATLAHELGHAYHGSIMKDLPPLNQEYPMTLAETASIFCETLVFNRALETIGESERMGVLEIFIQGATAVIVDILSRYKFETAVFERRASGELSPEELCELMTRAQLDTYGDGLDRKQLHPYMWAVKSHYYSANLPYYNFPYAFGLLLGLALYSNYTRDQQDFPRRYKQLLELTGSASANDVTREAGFDIEDPAFWRSGIDVVAGRVKEFSLLVQKARPKP